MLEFVDSSFMRMVNYIVTTIKDETVGEGSVFMDTEMMLSGLKPGYAAICEFGTFMNDIAVVREDGVVVLVNSLIEYDFWDARFNDCEWLLIEDPDYWLVAVDGHYEKSESFRLLNGDDGDTIGCLVSFEWSRELEFFEMDRINLRDVDLVANK